MTRDVDRRGAQLSQIIFIIASHKNRRPVRLKGAESIDSKANDIGAWVCREMAPGCAGNFARRIDFPGADLPGSV